MSIKKKNDKEQEGGNLENDIKKLERSGLIEPEETETVKKDKHGDNAPEEQQKSGDTERSDRRL